MSYPMTPPEGYEPSVRAEPELVFRAAGVSFVEGYPGNLLDLVYRIEEEGGVAAELVRDPENPHDLNAISIRIEGRHMGWVPRDVAAVLAPQLDEGQPWEAVVTQVAVDLDHRDRPGLAVRLTHG